MRGFVSCYIDAPHSNQHNQPTNRGLACRGDKFQKDVATSRQTDRICRFLLEEGSSILEFLEQLGGRAGYMIGSDLLHIAMPEMKGN